MFFTAGAKRNKERGGVQRFFTGVGHRLSIKFSNLIPFRTFLLRKRSMKTLLWILFWAGMGSTAMAQALIHVPPLASSRQTLATPVTVKIWDGNASFQKSPFESALSSCWVPREHYTAFFCKLEFLSMEATHVWFKIHAGDYDAYNRKHW